MNSDFNVGIIAVNRGSATALSSDGEIMQITNWFDSDGDETPAAHNAVAAVAECQQGWVTIDLSKFGPASVH